MKHHDSLRPIGKCKGCCLNLRTRCALGLEPKRVWSTGRCRRYNDLVALEGLAPAKECGAKLARVRRQTKAAMMATEPHYNGVLDPGKMASQARRMHTTAT